ncbi:hypothetical protein Salat_0047300 [Sesamum alatum]|uniref:B box-type domain-containing protein n=1 Tax=Sesamum alatum TaxID=300844 RepID=A0AAE2CWY1_9LAMI|nr:hypothetical protein Salat_0047300 [Sesamum alatum]
MSSPPTPAIQRNENAIQGANNVPKWLDQFLEKTFFRKCSAHHLRKNDLNRYCITCNASACKHCIATGVHIEHKVLTIYRHVYQDVVPLNQMENHLDCSKIQTYKCNKKWVISLTPLPHTGSGLLIEGDGACKVCKRKLTERSDRFCFCSIACKFQAISRRNRIQFRLRAKKTSQTKVAVYQQASTSESKRKRSRKGVPRRAI